MTSLGPQKDSFTKSIGLVIGAWVYAVESVISR